MSSQNDKPVIRRVYFYRAERTDPLLLARDCIDQALFERAVDGEPLLDGVTEVEKTDNIVGVFAACPSLELLEDLLERLNSCNLGRLQVFMSDNVEREDIEKVFVDSAFDFLGFVEDES